jgi:hypothetical protein
MEHNDIVDLITFCAIYQIEGIKAVQLYTNSCGICYNCVLKAKVAFTTINLRENQ